MSERCKENYARITRQCAKRTAARLSIKVLPRRRRRRRRNLQSRFKKRSLPVSPSPSPAARVPRSRPFLSSKSQLPIAIAKAATASEFGGGDAFRRNTDFTNLAPKYGMLNTRRRGDEAAELR